jgi:hypothetical protein
MSDAAVQSDVARRSRDGNAARASRVYCWLIRAGFVARGITYGVIGALALALALGAGTAGVSPSQEGALELMARDGGGRVALIVAAAGLLGFALWKFEQAVRGRGPEGGGSPVAKDRVANLAGGVAYLLFFAVAVQTLAGSGGSSSGAPRQAAAGVLGWPGGQELVAVAGFVLIGVSLYQGYEAYHCRFAEGSRTGEMGPTPRRVFLRLGQIGLTARSAVFALVGYFLLRTAIDYSSRTADGIDGALERLHHQPYGPWLVGLTGLGLLTFALFSLFESRYRRL